MRYSATLAHCVRSLLQTNSPLLSQTRASMTFRMMRWVLAGLDLATEAVVRSGSQSCALQPRLGEHTTIASSARGYGHSGLSDRPFRGDGRRSAEGSKSTEETPWTRYQTFRSR